MKLFLATFLSTLAVSEAARLRGLQTTAAMGPQGPGLGAATPISTDTSLPFDTPPAEFGDYQQETFAPAPLGTCVTNAVGQTCDTSTYPSIACCTSNVTGAFFNACCVSGFAGIQMGGSAGNEFDALMIQPTTNKTEMGECTVNGNNQGCAAVAATPGTPAALPTPSTAELVPTIPGVSGPCVAQSAATCTTPGYNAGTCTNQLLGPTAPSFEVCCPPCATGTYQSGDSCIVTLPDPAACGYNVGGIPGLDPAAPPVPAVVPGVPIVTAAPQVPIISTPITSASVPAVPIVAAPVPMPVAAPTDPVTGRGDDSVKVRPESQSGKGGPGSACSSNQDCVGVTYCTSSSTCQTMNSCRIDADCDNPGNLGIAKDLICTAPQTLKLECGGVYCESSCETPATSTMPANTGGAVAVNPAFVQPTTPTTPSTPSTGATTSTSTTTSTTTTSSSSTYTGPTMMQGGQLCPSTADEAASITNCCSFLPPNPTGNTVGLESQCVYQGSGGPIQCRCVGQQDDAGVQDCNYEGWVCREILPGGNLVPFTSF